MKRKSPDDPAVILQQANKEAVQRWGAHYPLSKALLSTWGILVVMMGAIGIPMPMIKLLFEESGFGWLQYVYAVVVFVPMLVFARNSRLRIQPYLAHVLAELGNPVCRKCEYDLRGIDEFQRCPECGAKVVWLTTDDHQHPMDAESEQSEGSGTGRNRNAITANQ